jgi:hypothetical protein
MDYLLILSLACPAKQEVERIKVRVNRWPGAARHHKDKMQSDWHSPHVLD